MTNEDTGDRLARDFVLAFDARDEAALRRLNEHYGRSFTFDDLAAEIWRRVYAFRQRSSRVENNFLALDEARVLVAQDAGYGSWNALVDASVSGEPPVPAFAIDRSRGTLAPRRYLAASGWDDLLSAMEDPGVTALDANGLMTDEALARLAELAHVTTLVLGGCRQVTDEGLRHLARMPQLQHLDLSGTQVTDRGLETLRQLPNLRTFTMTWQRGVSDAGIAHLRGCERVERLNLMGSPTGDGAIEALRGMSRLRSFKSGSRVTDAGLALLQDFPLLRSADRGAGDPGERVELLIDGPITDAGLARLEPLEGLDSLDLFWHVTEVTAAGFASVAKIPNLAALGCDGALASDGAMRHIGAMPRLRTLRAQGAAATDDGFEALSRSTTLEGFWGREAPGLGRRGFLALSRMPALRSLGVSCRGVDDDALAALSDFPALRELTPIDVGDAGFRHVGRCLRLERLTCMYCRDTTDVATAHLANLQLTYYYAGLTQITDESLAILGRMSSLEQVELYECPRVTDAGLPHLAALPRLRDVHFDGLPGVTLKGTRVFPGHVQVHYTT